MQFGKFENPLFFHSLPPFLSARSRRSLGVSPFSRSLANAFAPRKRIPEKTWSGCWERLCGACLPLSWIPGHCPGLSSAVHKVPSTFFTRPSAPPFHPRQTHTQNMYVYTAFESRNSVARCSGRGCVRKHERGRADVTEWPTDMHPGCFTSTRERECVVRPTECYRLQRRDTLERRRYRIHHREVRWNLRRESRYRFEIRKARITSRFENPFLNRAFLLILRF